MNAPAGTFLGKTKNHAIRFPRPLREFCLGEGWDLFRFHILNHDHFELEPVLEDRPESQSDDEDTYFASLSAEGELWIPEVMRHQVELEEQSVMMRVENGKVGVYLRNVFETLGFRP